MHNPYVDKNNSIDYINHTSLNNTLHQQHQQDAKQYKKIIIHNNNPSLSMIIHKKKTHMELAKYLHVAFSPPVRSTFEKAIKMHHFKTWSGLRTNILRIYQHL